MTSFKQMFRNTASAAAEALGLPALTPKPKKFEVDGKARKGAPYGKYINYKRTGPFYNQVGWLENGKPRMVRRYFHRFLHATKGWLTLMSPRPTVALPNMVQGSRVYGPRANARIDGFGRWQYPRRIVDGSKYTVLVPCVKNAHKMVRPDVERAPLAA